MVRLIERYGPPKEYWPDFINVPDLPSEFNLTTIYLDEKIRKGKGSRIAYLFGDKRITYRDLYYKVCVFANVLKAIGVQSGDRIAIRLPNMPEYPIAMLASLRIGAVYVSIFPLFKAREITHILNDAEVSYIITNVDLLKEVEEALPNSPTVKKVIVVGATEKEKARGFLSFEELMEEHKKERKFDAVNIHKDEVVFINYTSGTTGVPKGCIRVPSEYIAYGEYAAKQMYRITEDDVMGGTPTLAFAYGHLNFFMMPLYVGAASSLLTPPFTPERVFETIEDHGITHFVGVPSLYRQLVASKDIAKRYDLSTVRVCHTAGEPMSVTLYNMVKELFPGAEIFEHIGQTECGGPFISNRYERVKPGSLGVPAIGFEAKIVDDEGRELPPGEIGNLIYRGPTGTRYWKLPEKQAKTVKHGWNWAGDGAYMDSDGFFYFVSRMDDMIKVSGYLVSPHEIESILSEHPSVAEVAVAPVPDLKRGWVPKAFIVLRKGYEPSDKLKEELINFVADRISPVKRPREIEFVEALPKTETGKIQRVILKQREVDKYIKEHPEEAKILGLVK